MKKTFYITSLLAVFTLLAIVISGCGAAAPAPATPASAPVAPAATATQPSAATTQPTAAATRPAATATQPGAARPELQGIVAAFAKTKTASAFKVSEKLSGNGTIVQFSPNMPTSVVLVGADGEFKGKDYHVKLSGLAGMLFSDDPIKGIEVAQVGGKTYVHWSCLCVERAQRRLVCARFEFRLHDEFFRVGQPRFTRGGQWGLVAISKITQ